ncbi:glycosyltransferase [Halorussus salinisoli]|uniref:glycosyltransferase n=1 Tax=Halorussus salinisoli TaxID=2558242 RepID=UPI0010C1AF06|nr:glycosyltransferase [Halorussus salinisoli]
MTDTPPTTIIIPTTSWTTACSDVANQIGPKDELLVVCDDQSNDVAAQQDDRTDGVRIVFAGEPKRCSGKANAIAAGMRAATHDRIVWTDDDFEHPTDWLANLHDNYEENGPVTELPFFVGRDPLSILLEPMYAIGGTLGVYVDDIVWGGAVMFERSDLNEAAFLRELQQTVSDDGILTEYLDVTPLRRTRRVPVGGSIRETLERHVRFTKIVRFHDPKGFVSMIIVSILSLIAAVMFPLPMAVFLTMLQLGVYRAFGVHRWTFLLAYPTTLVQVPLLLYGLARRSFVWNDRRYRWRSKFDVMAIDLK